jgi:hypothetical protein
LRTNLLRCRLELYTVSMDHLTRAWLHRHGDFLLCH